MKNKTNQEINSEQNPHVVDYREIEQRLIEKKNRIGLIGGSLKLKVYDEAEHNVSAHITPQGWNIEISVKRGFDPIQDKRQKAYARKKKN